MWVVQYNKSNKVSELKYTNFLKEAVFQILNDTYMYYSVLKYDVAFYFEFLQIFIR